MIQSLIGAIAALLGFLFYSNSRRKSAEALLENQKIKELLSNMEGGVVKNDALLQIEEEKRKRIEEESNAKKNKDNTSDSNLIDFFKKR